MRFIQFSNDDGIKFTVRHSCEPRLINPVALVRSDTTNLAAELLASLVKRLGIPASLFEYRCPFDFLHEHDNWFEFHRRKYFDREPTYQIIRSMLNDDRKVSDYVIDDCNYSSAKLNLDHWKRMQGHGQDDKAHELSQQRTRVDQP